MCKKNYRIKKLENTRYLKCIVNNSVTVYDEIISVKESTNVTNTASINCDDKKVRYKIDCLYIYRERDIHRQIDRQI